MLVYQRVSNDPSLFNLHNISNIEPPRLQRGHQGLGGFGSVSPSVDIFGSMGRSPEAMQDSGGIEGIH